MLTVCLRMQVACKLMASALCCSTLMLFKTVCMIRSPTCMQAKLQASERLLQDVIGSQQERNTTCEDLIKV